MTSSKDNQRDNIFEIFDGMMFQLSRTKKMFMIMIISVLILPPLAILVTTSILDSPFGDDFPKRFEEKLQRQLDSGRITQAEYENMKDKLLDKEKPSKLLKPPQMIIFVISLVWLGIGIRQWIVLSKWDKKYQQFKAKQEEIDKKFEDESDEE